MPADLVLPAGAFGNISDDDLASTIAAPPRPCAPGAVVIWTRHTKAPDLTGAIRTRLSTAAFKEDSSTAPSDAIFSVGAHCFRGSTDPLGNP